jgi:hypothetical protein
VAACPRARPGGGARALHIFSRVAYGYWVIAYFTGATLVMAERAASG